jgi:hypothetical protein
MQEEDTTTGTPVQADDENEGVERVEEQSENLDDSEPCYLEQTQHSIDSESTEDVDRQHAKREQREPAKKAEEYEETQYEEQHTPPPLTPSLPEEPVNKFATATTTNAMTSPATFETAFEAAFDDVKFETAFDTAFDVAFDAKVDESAERNIETTGEPEAGMGGEGSSAHRNESNNGVKAVAPHEKEVARQAVVDSLPVLHAPDTPEVGALEEAEGGEKWL